MDLREWWDKWKYYYLGLIVGLIVGCVVGWHYGYSAGAKNTIEMFLNQTITLP